MWKFISKFKDPSNTQAIKKVQDTEDKNKKSNVLKSLQKALGRPTKKTLSRTHKTEAANKWGKYTGRAKVVFQPSHWMDRHIAKKIYLHWLKELYPEKEKS